MPALVQFKAAVIFSGETFVEATLTSAVTAGNTLCVFGTMFLGPTISDTLGNVWTVLPSNSGYYCLNSPGGTDTVRFTFPAGEGWGTIVVTEWTKASSGGGIDQHSNSSGTTLTATAGAVTPTVANELVIGFCNGGNNYVAAGGATQVDNSTGDLIEYLVQPTTSAVSLTATQATTGDWFFGVDTFKPLTAQTLTTTCTDSISLTSSLQRSIGKRPVDTLTLASTLGRALTKGTSDALTLTSAITRGVSRTSSESISLFDSRASSLGRSLADVLGLTEAMAFVRGKGVVITDTLSLTDSLTKSLTSRCVDALLLADISRRDLTRAFFEALSLDDARSALVATTKNDAFALTEITGRSLTTRLADGFSLLDSVFGLSIGDLGKYARKLVAQTWRRLVQAETKLRAVTAEIRTRTTKATEEMLYLDPKDPASIEDFQVDWAPVLGSDTISNSTWDLPADLTRLTDVTVGLKTTIRLSGGVAGQNYAIRNVITCGSGQVRVQPIMLPVQD